MITSNRSGTVIWIVPIALFLILAFIEIDLPGLYMDEAYTDAFVVKILDKTKTADRPLYNLPDNILDKSRRFPIAPGFYNGLIETYLGVPYYGLFGMSMFTLRTYHAMYGAVIVLLVFLILDRIVNRRIALWGCVLLATDAGFLVAYRMQGFHVIAPMPLFLLAVFLALPRENEARAVTAKRAFIIGMFYGLACYGYFVYLFFAPPLILALWFWGRPQLTARVLLAGASGCLAGYMPMLYALFSIAMQRPEFMRMFIALTGISRNISTRMAHIADIYGYFLYLLFVPFLLIPLLLYWMRSRLTKKRVLPACAMACLIGCMLFVYALSSIATQCPQIVSQFIARASSSMGFSAKMAHITAVISATFNNNQVPQYIAGSHYAPFASAKIYIWLFFAVSLLVLWRFKGHSRERKFLGFCILAIILFCAESMQFGDQIAVHHTTILLPIAYMALTAFVSILMTSLASEGTSTNNRTPCFFGWTVIITGTVLLLPINVSQHFALMRQLVLTGGAGLYSNANNLLAQDLETYNRDDKIVYCDWGYMLNTHFLTRGAIKFTRDIWDADKSENKKIPAIFAGNPRLTFVLPTNDYFIGSRKSIPDFRNRILQAARDANFQQKGAKTYFQKDGTPVVETITFIKDFRK